MKHLIVLCLLAATVSAIRGESVGASGRRHNRALALEYCPEKTTLAECENYAKRASHSIKYCHSYNVYDNLIQWVSCGAVSCGGNTRLVEEDLTKPYPDCCRTCELVQ